MIKIVFVLTLCDFYFKIIKHIELIFKIKMVLSENNKRVSVLTCIPCPPPYPLAGVVVGHVHVGLQITTGDIAIS